MLLPVTSGALIIFICFAYLLLPLRSCCICCRKKKFEEQIQNMSWKIRADEVRFVKRRIMSMASFTKVNHRCYIWHHNDHRQANIVCTICVF